MARPKYPSDAVDKTMLRFPPGLMERVKAAAAQNRRSMNSEIVARLEQTFAREDMDSSGVYFEPNIGNPPDRPEPDLALHYDDETPAYDQKSLAELRRAVDRLFQIASHKVKQSDAATKRRLAGRANAGSARKLPAKKRD